VLKSTGVWSPTPLDSYLLARTKLGRKAIHQLIRPQDWNIWTNSHSTRMLARATSMGVPIGMASAGVNWDVGGGNAFHEILTLVERDRAVFKKYIEIARTLSEVGWHPLRNFTLTDSSIWGERFGDKDDAAKTVYITCFNPSTTSSRTFTLSSPTYSSPAPATMTELISNTSKSWSSGSMAITLGPETLQVFKMIYA